MSNENMNSCDNNLNEDSLIERYIYEVIKRVPKKMRDDIRLELSGLIDDMRGEGATVSEVLEELGDPSEFAKRYRDENSYVIGPDYYDNYIWILKIGAIAILISALVSGLVNSVIDAEGAKDFIKEFMKEGFAVAISGLWSMVGVITVIFFALERMKVKVDIRPEDKWSIEKLPMLPDKKAKLSRGGSVVAIIAYVVLIGLFVYVPELFSVFEKSESGNGYDVVSCIVNLEKWNSIVPLFVIIFVIGIVEEIVKIIHGQYCSVVMYTSIISNTLGVVLSIIILKFTDVWNPNFANDLLKHFGKTHYGEGDILRYWGTGKVSNIILSMIILFSCIEVGVVIYNTLRYSEKKM